jgi:cytochrome P450
MEYHKWVDMIFASISTIPILAIRKKYMLFNYWDRLKGLFVSASSGLQARKEFFWKAHDMVSERLEKKTDRPDFFSFILANQSNESKALTRGEMDADAVVFMVAGSETTATTLSGTTFLLLRNPEAYAKLCHEVRSSFASADEITVERVNKLEYMIACLQEGLRYYPPVPTGLPRVVPKAGDTISGHYIPGGTSVYVSQHATYHSARNFLDADSYVPERWLGEEKYQNDKREVLNPFSFGPRNCLGKKYVEPLVILSDVANRVPALRTLRCASFSPRFCSRSTWS